MKKIKMKILHYSLLCGAMISINSNAFEINNGKVLQKSHFINNSLNATYIEKSPFHTEMTSLGAQADPLKIAIDYAYHTTTNHTVYIVNNTATTNTYYWYFNSCPQYYTCVVRGGAVELAPGGSFCESGTIQPSVKYYQIGFYENKAITQTTGFDPQYVQSIASIEVS